MPTESFRALRPPNTDTYVGIQFRSEIANAQVEEVSEKQIVEILNSSPLPVRLTEPLGHGGLSFAARVESYDSTDDPYCAVVQPIRITDNEANRLVGEHMAPYVRPQITMPIEGFNGRDMTLKVSQEIPGVTLQQLGVLGLATNRVMLNNLVGLSNAALELFSKHHVFPDIRGGRYNSPLKNILIHLLPLNSNNIMVDYGKGDAVLVDRDVNENYAVLENTFGRDRLKLLLSVNSLKVWTAALQGLAGLHDFREKIFRSKEASPAEEQSYWNNLDYIQKVLSENNVDYRIVGSAAYVSTMRANGQNVSISLRRPNGRKRDVDLLVMEDDEDKILELQTKFDTLTSQVASFPEISFTVASHPDKVASKMYEQGRVVFSKLAHKGGSYYSMYRDLITELPARLFEEVMVQTPTGTVKTVSPGTLAGLWLTRGGTIKPKDTEKVVSLLAATDSKIPWEFIDQSREMIKRYPKEIQYFQLRELVNYFSGGYDRQITHTLRQLFNRKK